MHRLRHVKGLHLMRQLLQQMLQQKQHGFALSRHGIPPGWLDEGSTLPPKPPKAHFQPGHLFRNPFHPHLKGFPMTRRNWKRIHPNSTIDALRLCKEFALEKKNLSIERIADRMGASHDSLYKWLATGRMPLISLTAYELACGCHFASEFLAASAGKLVISMPAGLAGSTASMVELNSGFAEALQLLTDFYAEPAPTDPTETVAALTRHLQQVAYHQANVLRCATPELDFGATA